MDISDTLAPKSDQLDAVDLIGTPRTFTVQSVSKGSSEQPVQVHLAEFPRPWRPGKSMRRVLANIWGPDASKWTGRRLTLFCDATVRFGGQEVGGVRISHMSHIDAPAKTPLIVTKGKSAVYVVEPLVEPAAVDELTVARLADLRAEYADATPERQAEIKAEAKKLQGGQS